MVPVVHVEFTNGFGNNLFQYIYARQLASKHKGRISVSVHNKALYAISSFAELGIDIEKCSFPNFPIIKINDKKASTKFYDKKFDNTNFALKGYFEDYRFYVEDREKIKSWFHPIKNINSRDLVFHLRLGDRLFYKVTYKDEWRIDASKYIEAIKQFDFDRLHIVTDMQAWDILTIASLSKMKFHRGGVGGKRIMKTSAGINNMGIAIDYFNSIYKALNNFNPVVRYGKKISEDFNYIRSFDKILFEHSTMSWWASFLSNAHRVGVYANWRLQKGTKNKNLSKVNIPAWFQWS